MKDDNRVQPIPRVVADRVWRDLATGACETGACPEVVRLAACVAFARAGALRVGELSGLRLEGLDMTGGRFQVVRRPQAKRSPAVDVERYDLDDGGHLVVNLWLGVRDRLLLRLDGAGHGFALVTVKATTGSGGRVWPAGLPVSAHGLDRSWRRYALRANAAGGVVGELLPTRWEQVRRAWQ